MLVWPSSLHPVAFAVLTLAAIAGGVLLWRRLRERFSAPQAVWLFVPKTVALACVVLALAEPAWRREKPVSGDSRFLVVVDTSASMGVSDGTASRLARATRLTDRIKASLPSSFKLETLGFDTSLKPLADDLQAPAADAGTDLAGCLRVLSERADPPAGIVLLTDGGDESVDNPALPAAPLFILGMGTGDADKPDTAIEDVQAPVEVEAEIMFDLSVDLRVRGAAKAPFAGSLAKLPVILSEETDAGPVKKQETVVDLSHGRVRSTFHIKAPAQGPLRLKVEIPALPGELSALNNSRPLTIQVRRRSLHVLFFTRELGLDFKLLRQELGRDPGVTLTALYRTLGERFTLQGERLPGDEELEAGFPDNSRTLALYDAVILGAFPASDWPPAAMKALADYVDQGGSVLFLGGEQAFGRGGYAGTPLEPLFPWQIRVDEPPLQTGAFPVSIPRESASHPILAGLEPLFAREKDVTVESINAPGVKRPAADVLLQAPAGGSIVALLAVQPYGKGRAGALASNTLWKWARRSESLGEAYGLLLRQWVRWAAGEADGGRLLAIRWDRDRYRPGEEAQGTVILAGRDTQGAEVTASLTDPDGRTASLPVEPQPGGRDAYKLRVPFTSRGTYSVSMAAVRQGAVLETVVKTWVVAPFLPEGAHLIPDEARLAGLSEKTGGFFAPEGALEDWLSRLRNKASSRTVTIETPLSQTGPWLALVFFGALLSDWILRRRNNLV